MRPRAGLLLAAALTVLAFLPPPVAQPPAYHDFTDQRTCGLLPNCLDTASNALFVLAGLIGLRFLSGAATRRGGVPSSMRARNRPTRCSCSSA